MPREDLLGLTADDLASLTNRGTVKRAQKELESGELRYDIEEGPGNRLLVRWSNGIQCEFHDGKSIHDATCSSGLLGISRHIVRSVLAYQTAQNKAAPTTEESLGPAAEAEPPESISKEQATPAPHAVSKRWDPGQFTDQDLVDRFGKAAISKARARFESGALVELTRGSKPVAIFLDENCCVRFMVPGDLRYVTADCAETALPRFVATAVWAFRALPPDKTVGILSLQQSDVAVPMETLEKTESLTSELFTHGLANASATLSARFSRLEQSLRKASLIWPAELIHDLSHQFDMYANHDARFEPESVSLIVGELIARTRAIRADNKTVPQLLIRGTRFDRSTDIASGRYIGIGLGVRAGKRQTKLNAYLQDADTGIVATIERTFTDPDPESGETPKTFEELAGAPLYRGITMSSLATSQVLLKSGKRTPRGELILPRTATAFSTNPQTFQWEQLKPPFAAENFTQLTSRLDLLPPSYLRPRRRTEGLHVVALSKIDEVSFDIAQQRLIATLHDHDSEQAMMTLPYHARADVGFNAFVELLNGQGKQAKFIAGHVTLSNRRLIVTPIAIVIGNGHTRFAANPWIPSLSNKQNSNGSDEQFLSPESDPIQQFLYNMRNLISELLLIGIQHCGETTIRLAEELTASAEQIGFSRIAELLRQLHVELVLRRDQLRYDSHRAVKLTAHLCLINRIGAA